MTHQGQTCRGTLDAGGRRHADKAELFLANGDIYVGGFVDGKRSGIGNLFRKDSGDLFQGHWLNDCREGPGILLFGNSGKTLRGHWVDDVCVAGEFAEDGGLPPLGLSDPEGVLREKERTIEEGRRLYRADFLPVETLLPGEVLAKANALFDANVAAFATKDVAARKIAVQTILDILDIKSAVSEEAVREGELRKDVFLRLVAVNFVKARY